MGKIITTVKILRKRFLFCSKISKNQEIYKLSASQYIIVHYNPRMFLLFRPSETFFSWQNG